LKQQKKIRRAVSACRAIAPLAESVPPKLYGGTERVVDWLADELVSLAHDVTLFASGDSTTRASWVPIIPRAIQLNKPRSEPFPAYADFSMPSLEPLAASTNSSADILRTAVAPIRSEIGQLAAIAAVRAALNY
jgi:hypothetical protein